MSFQSKQYVFYKATDEDQLGIQEVFKSGKFEGDIAVQYLRDPNPLASFQKEGDKCFLVVLKDKEKDQIIGTGSCIIRSVYWQGEIKRLGYLAGLKLLPEYQKKIPFIPAIYRYLYEEMKEEVDLYFTTILSDNIAVQKMLEKPRKVMPLYIYAGEYKVYFCKSGIRKRKLEGDIRYCTKDELEALYEAKAKTVNGSLTKIDAYDLKNATFYGLFENGKAVTGGYVLNQQSYKQYVVKSYSFLYSILSKCPSRLLGYPSFPKINEAANYACATIWDLEDNKERVERLWAYMRMEARSYDFLMIGLHEKDPLRSCIEKGKHIPYSSRCYWVDWQHNKAPYEKSLEEKLAIDVAFL